MGVDLIRIDLLHRIILIHAGILHICCQAGDMLLVACQVCEARNTWWPAKQASHQVLIEARGEVGYRLQIRPYQFDVLYHEYGDSMFYQFDA